MVDNPAPLIVRGSRTFTTNWFVVVEPASAGVMTGFDTVGFEIIPERGAVMSLLVPNALKQLLPAEFVETPRAISPTLL